MSELRHKAATTTGVTVKDADEGAVTAIVARVGVVDLEGDLFLPGSFGTQEVRVSSWGHGSWPHKGNAPPLGRGTITERGDTVTASLRFFMDTAAGREGFATVKGLGDLAQWSFGFLPARAEEAPVTPQLQAQGARRAYRRVPVTEVSPVLLAASVGTRTLAAKCEGCGCSVDVDPAEARRELQVAEQVLRASKAERRNLKAVDTATAALAFGAAQVAHSILGHFAVFRGTPRVKFFDPERVRGTDGYVNPRTDPHVLHLAADLKHDPERLVHTTLHEVAHLGQKDPKAPGAEDEADRFAREWTRPVLRALQRGNGSPPVLRDGRPPWPSEGFRSGQTVISRTTRRAYRYDPRATYEWSELP